MWGSSECCVARTRVYARAHLQRPCSVLALTALACKRPVGGADGMANVVGLCVRQTARTRGVRRARLARAWRRCWCAAPTPTGRRASEPRPHVRRPRATRSRWIPAPLRHLGRTRGCRAPRPVQHASVQGPRPRTYRPEAVARRRVRDRARVRGVGRRLRAATSV